MRRRSVAERLALYSVDGPVPEHAPELGPCRVWTGVRNDNGYGRIRAGGQLTYVHIVVVRQAGIYIPPGYDVEHLCRNRACLQLSHLEVVTHRVNCLRGIGPTAINARKTSCEPGGHPLSGANLYMTPDGRRHCRTCANVRRRAYRARRKLAKVA